MKQQQYLAALVLACITTATPAQTIEDRILGCAAESDQQQRLTCFDTLAADVASGAVNSAPEQDQPPTDSSPNPVARSDSPENSSDENFGLEHKVKNAEVADELQTQVAEIYKDGLGKMLLILDNGQIWQQKDSKTLIIKKGDSIFIERGFMSAFYLSANGKKRIRVARIK